MGKNYSENLQSKNTGKDLTMKQMFDISEKLIAEQSDEIYGVNTINWSDSEEYERCKKNWKISLNKSGKNAPMRLRSDFRTAVTLMNRLHRESGEERAEPIPFQRYQRWHSSSSSSSSWCQWDKKLVELMRIILFFTKKVL